MSSFVDRNLNTEYSPEELSILGTAYDTICDGARLRDASSIVRDLVGSSVIDVASTGERDPLRIADLVMTRLGLHIRHAA